jgi:hypothetical protein
VNGEHGATPIRYLDRLGVLGPRMIGVNACSGMSPSHGPRWISVLMQLLRPS